MAYRKVRDILGEEEFGKIADRIYSFEAYIENNIDDFNADDQAVLGDDGLWDIHGEDYLEFCREHGYQPDRVGN